MIASMAPDGRHAVRLRRFIPHAAANLLDVEEVTTSEALAALTPAWEGLLERSDLEHPFLTPAWIRSSWEAFGEPGALLVLVVRRGGQVVAIAPFTRRVRTMCGLQVRAIETIQHPDAPRSDILLSTHPTQACGAILEHLLRSSVTWDVLELGPVPASSIAYREIRRIARVAGRLTGILDAGGTRDVPSASPRRRASLTDRFERLRPTGEVTLETVSGGPGMHQALDDVLRLAVRSSAATEQFYREVARRAAALGWLRLQFLKAGERRVAAIFALRYRNTQFFVRTGDHPEFAPLSPGRLACLLSMEDASAEGLRGDAVQPHRSLFVFPSHLKAQCLYLAKFGDSLGEEEPS